MKKICKIYFFTVLILLFFSLTLANQQQNQPRQYRQTPSPISVHKVKGNIYEVKGGRGANTGFFIGEKEVVVIDAKMTDESAQAMIAEIKKLTTNPIKTIIITHSDGDHVNGLTGFPEGLNIIAHENTKKDMDNAFKNPEKRKYLPGKTFSKDLRISVGNKTIELYYFGPAHTDGDAVVLFPEEKVAFIGDLVFLGRDPLIHKHKNGCSFGLVKVLKAILELNADTFIHGHGDRIGKSEIAGLIKSIEEKQDKIAQLIKENKSLEEIKKIFDVKDRPPRQGRARRPSFVEVIYLEILEQNK